MLITYNVERVLDWRLVVHWSEEVVLDCQDDGLLQEFVTHQKLFAGPRNISVTMFNTHTSESSLLHLESYKLCEIEANLSLLRGVDTWVRGCGPDVEALITDLVYHYLKLIYRKRSTLFDIVL